MKNVKFSCKADFTFYAKNIDDALTKLSKHFNRIRDGKDSKLIEFGEVHIEPVEVLPSS